MSGHQDGRSLAGVYRRPPGRTAGYSKIALTMIAAKANPATTPATRAADNSNMKSPIVLYPTSCKRRGRAPLCCSARLHENAWIIGGTFGRFSVYCGYGPGTSRLVAGALSRLQSAAPALTQRAKALAGAPKPARVKDHAKKTSASPPRRTPSAAAGRTRYASRRARGPPGKRSDRRATECQ
jgi:hypothetical protein